MKLPITEQERLAFSRSFNQEETIRLLEQAAVALRKGMLIDATGMATEATARLILMPRRRL